jgi:hypothetical protein
VCFETAFTDHVLLTIFDYTIDLMFFLDIVITFFTTYVHPRTGEQVLNNLSIAWHYLKGRFWIDLLASVPFELFFSPFLSSDSALSIFGLLKLVRLLRLGRIITYLSFSQHYKIGAKIAQLILFLILLVHWIGCLWFYLV